MRYLLCVATILSTNYCVAQEQPHQPASGARELFYSGTAPKDTLPPPAAKAPTPAKSTKAVVPAPSTGALNLGLRYTLLLVGKSGDGGQPTDPERNFRKGDCVAVNIESNRLPLCDGEGIERRLGPAIPVEGRPAGKQSHRSRPGVANAEA